MNPKYRFFYLLGGAIGLALLVYNAITTFPDIDPVNTLVITVPDMLFFYLAYKTYPVEYTTTARVERPVRRVVAPSNVRNIGMHIERNGVEHMDHNGVEHMAHTI